LISSAIRAEIIVALQHNTTPQKNRITRACADDAENSNAETDMNVVMNDQSGFIEVQGATEGQACNRGELDAMLDLAHQDIQQIC
jgi:ribonuclease PH